MKTINTVNAAVIAKAATEAGIRENENYNVYIIASEDILTGIILETEWNRIECWIDTETEEVLGIMAQPKSIKELLSEGYVRVSTASADRKAA
jgi:hypothetical protein